MFLNISQENKKKSPAWKIFRALNKDRATCTICLETISTSGRNTTGITRHAEKIHPAEYEKAKLEATKSSQLAHSTTSLLALSFASGGIPLQFIENKYFRMFLEKIGYEGVGADTMRKFIFELSDESLKIVKKQLESESKMVCIFDGWSSSNSRFHAYALFLVFVDKFFVRRTLFIGCRNIKGSANSENVASTLASILDTVDCDFSRIHHVVTDGAKNLVKLSETLEIKRSWCICHAMALYFRDMMVSIPLKKVMLKAQKTASILCKSVPIREKFYAFAKVLNNHANHPKTFSPTRWGGAFLLLRDFLQCLEVLRSVPELVEFVPSREEKLMGCICVDLLEPVFDVMTELEADDSTASCIIPNLVTIQKVLDTHKYKDTRIGKMSRTTFKTTAADFLEDNFLRQSAFLDPRYSCFDDAIAPIKWSKIEKTFLKEFAKEIPAATNDYNEPKNGEPPMKKKKTSPLADLMSKQKERPGSSTLKTEVASYKSQITGLNGRPPHKSDPLEFWKINQFKYPLLSKLARELLSVPSSSASTERLFSKATGLVSNIKRNRMSPQTLDAILQVSCRGQLLSDNSKIFQQEEYDSEDEEEIVNEKEHDNDYNDAISCVNDTMGKPNEPEDIADLSRESADGFSHGDYLTLDNEEDILEGDSEGDDDGDDEKIEEEK